MRHHEHGVQKRVAFLGLLLELADAVLELLAGEVWGERVVGEVFDLLVQMLPKVGCQLVEQASQPGGIIGLCACLPGLDGGRQSVQVGVQLGVLVQLRL